MLGVGLPLANRLLLTFYLPVTHAGVSKGLNEYVQSTKENKQTVPAFAESCTKHIAFLN